MVSRVHVNVQYDSYTAYVLMRKWETGTLSNNEDASELCLKFCEKSDYKFCPGIDPEQYEKEYYTSIRFHIKSVQRTEFPFARVDSLNCLLWFKLAPNATADEKSRNKVRCRHCKCMVLDLECQKRRTIAESPMRRIKRQKKCIFQSKVIVYISCQPAKKTAQWSVLT